VNTDKYPLVKVAWVDSGLHLEDGWRDVPWYVNKAECTNGRVSTVGHLIHEDDQHVIVGLSLDIENDTVFSAQVIWQSNIESMEYLEPKS
jgi:hypothetical protein